MKIALFGKRISPVMVEGIFLLLDKLAAAGVSLCYHRQLFLDMLPYRLDDFPRGELYSNCEDMPSDVDMLLAIGGDGTFLRAVNLLNGREIPVAGINFGRLGFLTTAKMGEGLEKSIDDILQGRYSVEKRLMIKVSGDAVPNGLYPCALNELSVQRRGASMLEFTISVDEKKLPSYLADGVIIATPTGSTAYSLSVGGPIVAPASDVLIIAPIAPHNLNVRPIVIPANSVIELGYSSRKSTAVATIDTRAFDFAPDSRITVCKSGHYANYVSLFDNNFIDALKDKLLWGEDKRSQTDNRN